MPRKCLVCIHPKREEIDQALIRGEAYREIGRRYKKLDKSCLSRHKNLHLSSTLIKAQEAEDALRGKSLWEQIEWLRSKALTIARKAEDRKDYRTALAGIRELTRIVELMAKLRGDLNSQPINIILSPQWIELRTRIVSTLEEFPEARARLAEVLGSAG